MTGIFRNLAIACAVSAIGSACFNARAEGPAPETVHSWDKQTLSVLASLPIQDGGRVKPLDTFARFTLLKLNGKRTYTTEEGERLSALAWLLNVLFFPDNAVRYRHFCVDNSEVLVALGLNVDKPRGRYSYEELAPGRAKLFDLAQNFLLIEDQKRDALQRMTLNLASNVRDFEALSRAFDFARMEFQLSEGDPLRQYFPDGLVRASACLAQGAQFAQFLKGNDETARSFRRINESLLRSRSLALFPPADVSATGWHTPSSLASLCLSAPEAPAEIQSFAALEELVRVADDDVGFRNAALKLHSLSIATTAARDEYARVPVEVAYYRMNPLFWAQWLFVLSFIILAITWLVPQRRWIESCHTAFVLVPWSLLVIGIVFRCIIRWRPPVSTLYESILFVTAVFVLVAILLERINRQRVAMALASLAGTAGLFLAFKHETTGGNDTMPSLVAVLDTNFWLSTHVTTVTTGYAAGLLAGFLGCIYIVSQLVRFRHADTQYHKSLTRMIYGTVCFGLLFSFVGTVLGGIWANYSWGRFWGWDPKENGALLIVLCNLGILHARLGGIVRDLGLAMGAVFGGMVVAFSWWGVNLLGVGLHSYGFTSGVWNILFWFWLSQLLFMAAGAFVFIRSRYFGLRRQRVLESVDLPIVDQFVK